MQKSSHLRKIILCAILIALQIILSRYVGIQTQFIQTSLGFVPIAICSALQGPIYGSACALISDFLGVILAGTNAYCPLFSINAIIYALFYSFFLYKKEFKISNIIWSVLLQTILIAIPLTPVWLYIYYNFWLNMPHAFHLMAWPQVLVRLIEIPIKIAVLIPVCKFLIPKLKKALILSD